MLTVLKRKDINLIWTTPNVRQRLQAFFEYTERRMDNNEYDVDNYRKDLDNNKRKVYRNNDSIDAHRFYSYLTVTLLLVIINHQTIARS